MSHHAQVVRTADVRSYKHPPTDATQIVVGFDKMGIDDVRSITDQAQLRPATSDGQLFVISATFITHEAQNALLKLLEEPPAATAFVLVLPPAMQLLPTLLSRIGQESTLVATVDTDPWSAFATATYAERLQQIDAWHKSKDTHWLTAITHGVHTLDHQGLDLATLTAISYVGAHLQTRGASNKMLLEHLALALPLRK